METDKERQHGESWEEPFTPWKISISFDLFGIIKKIKRYLAKRKLRRILKNRIEISRAGRNASKL